MKKLLFLCSLALFIGVGSCKKNKLFKKENGQASADNQAIQAQTDGAASDANTAIGNYTKLSGKMNQANGILSTNICGATIDTTGLYMGTVMINYNGTVCDNRKREGSIRLTIIDHALGKRWKDAGCVLKVDYLSYKVTRASDGKSLKFNGTHYVTNVNGGTWLNLVLNTQPNLVHTIKGDGLSVEFEDGHTSTWNIHRQYTYTWNGSVLTCTGEGIGTYNGISSLENWGTTRDGDEFTSQVTTPVVWNTTCGAWAPITGEVVIKVDSKFFELKCNFGVDASGNSVTTAPNSCPYGWKVEWKYKNKTNHKIFGYY
ncbi:MAG: hypothetical protein JST26_05215 [Bacteroidetes bacterium]|nr:hypothetical protein [Bacteroidota bacterium]